MGRAKRGGREEEVLRLSWSEKSGLLETSGCFSSTHTCGEAQELSSRTQREGWKRSEREGKERKTNTMQKWQVPKRMEMVDVIFRRFFARLPVIRLSRKVEP